MKDTVRYKIKIILQSYGYNTILTLMIFILFWVGGYSYAIKEYDIFLNNKKIELKHGICSKNSEQYIHIEDLIDVFSDNVYYDKISGKIILTTHDRLIKISNDDDKYIEIIDNEKYCNLYKIMNDIQNNITISRCNIYISTLKYVDGTVIKNRVELYDKTNGNVLCYLKKQDSVKIYLDKKATESGKNIITVEASINGKKYYGNALNTNFNYIIPDETIEREYKKVVLVKADNLVSASTDLRDVDMVALNMFRLSSINSLTKLEYIDNISDGVKVVATINNGQKSSNYDSDIVTGMLNSESNRERIIQQVLDNTGDLAGVNLDFSEFKVSDRDNYTQFIKELSAIMHQNNKMVIVNVDNSKYIDVQQISKVVDYIVIRPYFARTISSKTSGPISSIYYVEQSIKNMLQNNLDCYKVILEIPAYTILWTERRGTIINAEQYNMKAMESYIKNNNVNFKLDNVSGQNFLNYTKGITTYKMWLEDRYSIVQKLELVNKHNLAGVSIYKSGMEIKDIYEDISKAFEN